MAAANSFPMGAPVATDGQFIYFGGQRCEVQNASIAVSSSGANAIVAAQGASKRIVVVALKVVANAAVNGKWQSAANDLTGLSYWAANGVEVLPLNPAGWFKTNPNEALNLNLSGAVAVGGHLNYIVVAA